MKIFFPLFFLFSLGCLFGQGEKKKDLVKDVIESVLQSRFELSEEGLKSPTAVSEVLCGTRQAAFLHRKEAESASKSIRDVKSAARKFERDFVASVKGEKGVLAVWVEPRRERKSKSPSLEASAQGLMAFLHLADAGEDVLKADELEELAEFLLLLQRADGAFQKDYNSDGGGRFIDPLTKSVGPGQATMALLMLYQKDRNLKWLEAAQSSLQYLAKERINLAAAPKDHWTLVATEEYLKTQGDGPEDEKELFIRHTELVCDSLLEDQIRNDARPGYMGTFEFFGVTNETSTALQGLLAALSYLPKNHKMRPKIEEAVEMGVQFLLSCQITDGENKGCFPFALKSLNPLIPNSQDFNKSAGVVSIQYTANALDTLLRYTDWKLEKSKE